MTTFYCKLDERPRLNGWAPGNYVGECSTCSERYFGDKRASVCADCAYTVVPSTSEVYRQEKWDRRFLELAGHIAQWSKDPSTKVGAVIVRPDLTVASVGFNGFPRGFGDSEFLLGDRELKYRFVVHAEQNAIAFSHEPVRGYTLYSTLPVCNDCCKIAIQAGIKRFVSYAPTTEQKLRWRDSFAASEQMILDCKLDQTLFHHDGADWPDDRDCGC